MWSQKSFVLFLLAAVVVAVVDSASSPPLLTFVHEAGGRSLMYSNNPERLLAADLADSTNTPPVCILRVDGVRNNWRHFFEHLNNVGVTIGWGVVLENPNKDVSATVTTTSQAYTNEWSGGIPWAQAFNNPVNVTATVGPGERYWIWRNDQMATNNSLLTGVMDFEVSLDVTKLGLVAYTLIYSNYSKVDFSVLQYDGYVTRTDQPWNTSAALVYKGVSPTTRVVTSPLAFQVDDTLSPNSSLPVMYPAFDTKTQAYAPTPTLHKSWVSNINPLDPDAVTSDMVPFLIPGYGYINPVQCCDGTGNYPNVGNWGVVYTIQGTITNLGTRSRNVELTMISPGCSASLAYNAGNNFWVYKLVNPGDPPLPYTGVTVPPGQTVGFEGDYVLGGPSCGAEEHTFVITN